MTILGNRIKKLRENKNMSQKDLAKDLHISNSTLSQYESGIRVPSDEIKTTIAKYFDVSMDYLMGLSSDLKTSAIEKEDNRISILARNASNLTEDQIKLVENLIDQFKKENDIE